MNKNIFDYLKDNTIIITKKENKEYILNEINNYTKEKLSLKFMTKEEFIKHLFFDYDSNTIIYLMHKYNIKYDIAKMYIENIYNLYYINNTNEIHPKIQKLLSIKEDLINNNKLKVDKLFHSYIKNKTILIYDYPIDKEFEKIILKYHITKVNPIYQTKSYQINEFSTINEELAYTCEQIRNLLNQKVDINNIFLIIPNDYYTMTNTIFNLNNIPINLPSQNKMISYSLVKDFLKELKKSKNIEKTIELIKNKYDLEKEEVLNIYNTLINIINKIDIDNIEDIIIILEQKLKNQNLNIPKLKNAINLTNLNTTIKEDKYVFILGFNSDNYPSITKDIDYLPDNLKEKLDLTTSYQYNQISKDYLINKLNSIKNIIISYSIKNNSINYFKSPLITELNMKIITTHELTYNYSNLYNKLTLATFLDNYFNYKIKNKKLDTLYATYPSINYLSYDNKYQKIDPQKLQKELKNGLNISYSSLNNYYKCSFRYYLDNILKLYIKENTFDLYIGNLFHYILSICFKENFNYEVEFQNYLNNHDPLTKKEQVFITKLKEELLYIINYLKETLNYTNLDKSLYEEKIIVNIKDNIKVTITGIIDKVMYKEENGNTYLVVIDYKTGKPDINLNNTIYGINMQLPIYLYLIKEKSNFQNIKVSGFYYQKILNNELNFKEGKTKEEQKNENLKLIGYSNSNIEILEKFDKTYQNSRIIKSLKITSNAFSKNSKLLNDTQIDKLINICKDNIKKAIISIGNADFTINPKVIGDDHIGCKYCPYSDICYKTYADSIILEEQKNLDFLN